MLQSYRVTAVLKPRILACLCQFAPCGKHCFSITKMNWLMMLQRSNLYLFWDSYKTHKSLCGQSTDLFFNVKAGDTYNNHCALKAVSAL